MKDVPVPQPSLWPCTGLALFSLLYWEVQNWTQHSRCGLTSAEMSGRISSSGPACRTLIVPQDTVISTGSRQCVSLRWFPGWCERAQVYHCLCWIYLSQTRNILCLSNWKSLEGGTLFPHIIKAVSTRTCLQRWQERDWGITTLPPRIVLDLLSLKLWWHCLPAKGMWGNINYFLNVCALFCAPFRQGFRRLVPERQFLPVVKLNHVLLIGNRGDGRKTFALHSTLNRTAPLSHAEQTIQSCSPKQNISGHHFMKANGGGIMTVLKLSSHVRS